MNIPFIPILLIIVALLIAFLIRFYRKKNRQDLQEFKKELRDSEDE